MHTVTTLPPHSSFDFFCLYSLKQALKALKLLSTASRNIVSSPSWNVEVGPQISTYDVDALYAEDNQEGFLNYWGLEDQSVNY